jgi:glucose-6-phosphate dehydrogenase assembly protein OpcA
MNQSITTRSFLSGRLAHVDIAKIERELAAAWAAAEDSENEGDHVTRACALNLVLFSSDTDTETVAGNLLDEITINHPCRAILVVARPSKNEPGSNATVDAWVSARCHITDSKSRRQICCEQITVRGEGASTNELASVVLPLVLSDVPVFLWWRDKLDPQKLVPFISGLDHVIVDSSKSENVESFFQSLELTNKLLKDTKHKPTLGDLNWRRSLPWRKATALSFDDQQGPLPLSSIYSLKELEISFQTSANQKNKNNLNEPLLFVGWIATRLTWNVKGLEFTNPNTINLKFTDQSSRETNIKLIGVCDQKLEPGSIGSVTLKVTAPSPKTISVQQPLQSSEASLIFDELEVSGADSVYEEVSQFISSQLIPLLKSQTAA